MATSFEMPGFAWTRPAAADFSTGAGQYRFVMVDGNSKAAAATLAGPACGVRQNKPKADEECAIISTGISFVELGETVVAGEWVKSMANGLAGEADTAADYIHGLCIVGGVSGELASVLLTIGFAKF